jgi:hypothetical protein
VHIQGRVSVWLPQPYVWKRYVSKYCLILGWGGGGEGTDLLSRDFGNQLSIYRAWHLRRVNTSVQVFWCWDLKSFLFHCVCSEISYLCGQWNKNWALSCSWKLCHAVALSSESPVLRYFRARDRRCISRKYCRVIRYHALPYRCGGGGGGGWKVCTTGVTKKCVLRKDVTHFSARFFLTYSSVLPFSILETPLKDHMLFSQDK